MTPASVILTLDDLRDLGACASAITTFPAFAPNGCGCPSAATIRTAFAAGLDAEWLAYALAPAPLWAEYERQKAPLWAEYERQVASLRAEYQRQVAAVLADLLAVCWPVAE